MSRVAQLGVPVLTFLVVAFAVLVAGAPRPVLGARVYGGPTEGKARLSLRIASLERDGESERAVWNGPLSVRATPVTGPSVVSEARASRATLGVSEVTVLLPAPLQGALELEVRDANGALLAAGRAEVSRAQWLRRARRRGGWISGRHTGELVVSVAPARGVFVVGSVDSLRIRVQRGGQPAAGYALSVSADGARMAGALPRSTDAEGRAQVELEPTELNPTVRVEAIGQASERAVIETPLPLAPGGFHAQVTPQGIRVDSAVPASEVFFSLISESSRLAGGVLELASNGRGGSFGLVPMEARAEPRWIVLASSVDQSGSSAIGWPIASNTEPNQTLDVPDALLVDGLPAAFEREVSRRSRVRWLSAGFIALAFALCVVLLVQRVRAADREITLHLREGLDADATLRVAPRRLLSVLVALCSIGLTFIVVLLVLLSRAR